MLLAAAAGSLIASHPPMTATPVQHPKPENLLLNLVCNIALPVLILSKFSGEHALGPMLGLVVALVFPLAYGSYDFIRRRKANFISIIGFVSVLLSGGFGLLKVDVSWFAVKGAALPALIGVAVLISMRTKTPLIQSILYNPQVIDVEKVDAALAERGKQADFDRLLARASYLLAGTFFLSAVLNYGLFRHLLRSPTGTEAFNGELARVHLLEWPVVTLPSMVIMMFALWRLLHGIKVLTGLDLEAVFKAPPEKK